MAKQILAVVTSQSVYMIIDEELKNYVKEFSDVEVCFSKYDLMVMFYDISMNKEYFEEVYDVL